MLALVHDADESGGRPGLTHQDFFEAHAIGHVSSAEFDTRRDPTYVDLITHAPRPRSYDLGRGDQPGVWGRDGRPKEPDSVPFDDGA